MYQQGVGDDKDLLVRISHTTIDGAPVYQVHIHRGAYYLGDEQPILEHYLSGNSFKVEDIVLANSTDLQAVQLPYTAEAGALTAFFAGNSDTGYTRVAELPVTEDHIVEEDENGVFITVAYMPLSTLTINGLFNLTRNYIATGTYDFADPLRVSITTNALKGDKIRIQYTPDGHYAIRGDILTVRAQGETDATVHFEEESTSPDRLWYTVPTANLHPSTGATSGFVFVTEMAQVPAVVQFSTTPKTGTLYYTNDTIAETFHINAIVLDELENPIPGLSLTWKVSTNAGSSWDVLPASDFVSSSAVTTDSSGCCGYTVEGSYLGSLIGGATPLQQLQFAVFDDGDSILLNETHDIQILPWSDDADTYIHLIAEGRNGNYSLAAWIEENSLRVQPTETLRFYIKTVSSYQEITAQRNTRTLFPFHVSIENVRLPVGATVVARNITATPTESNEVVLV